MIREKWTSSALPLRNMQNERYVCDHQECYKEVGSQAVAYTTGVPAMIGAMMLMTGVWNKPGVHNIEEFDPDPFMDALNKWGLPWKESFSPELVD